MTFLSYLNELIALLDKEILIYVNDNLNDQEHLKKNDQTNQTFLWFQSAIFYTPLLPHIH